MSLFNKKLNILVLGSDGMLGHDVYENLMLQSQNKHSIINNVIGMDKNDICKNFLERTTDSQQKIYERFNFSTYFTFHKHYDYVINCVAMTDTVSAENTREGYYLSYKLNALFVKKLAHVCNYFKMKLIHISTDYVFSERCDSCGVLGYWKYDTPFPVNNYGMHKLLGEQFIQKEMKKKNYAILRTSWLYGNYNKKSFVHKFIKNAFKCMDENRQIEVTENEYSVPTSTTVVMKYINKVLYDKHYGIIHAVCRSHNPVSRLEFAKEIAITYNDLIKSHKCDNRTIDYEKIIGVERNDKLQPENSFMWFTDLWYDEEYFEWQSALRYFIRVNFEDLKELS